MTYKLVFEAILCDRFISNFMRCANVGIEHVGIGQTISFTTESEPTDEYIKKMIKVFESTKDKKTLKQYYTCVKHVRTEIVEL